MQATRFRRSGPRGRGFPPSIACRHRSRDSGGCCCPLKPREGKANRVSASSIKPWPVTRVPKITTMPQSRLIQGWGHAAYSRQRVSGGGATRRCFVVPVSRPHRPYDPADWCRLQHRSEKIGFGWGCPAGFSGPDLSMDKAWGSNSHPENHCQYNEQMDYRGSPCRTLDMSFAVCRAT
jgi:hypothetical protein